MSAVADLPLAWRALQADPHVYDNLTPAEELALAYAHDLWARPSQIIPRQDEPAGQWRYWGAVCGRGWGKSWAIATEINRRVEDGEARRVGLMGPTEDRVDEVQVAWLVNTSPPWFRAERYLGGVRWPNGVRALCFSAEEPGHARGDNLDLAWLNEIVAWDPDKAIAAFNNITTATRVGRAQVLWDTTTEGRNAVIAHLFTQHKRDPKRYPIARGSMFDNPTLDPDYVKDEIAKYVPGSRKYKEEILGLFLDEAAGALWEQSWIDKHRVQVAPTGLTRVVAVDPALSSQQSADETGLVVGGRDARGHVYLERDHSGHLTVETWGDIAVRECIDEYATGVIVERNHLGDNPAFVIRSRARTRGRAVELLGRDDSWPARNPAVIYVREVTATESKGARARAPAAETEAGRVHLVGDLPKLEDEMTTYEPGRKSPNRLDAAAWLVNDLLGLVKPEGGARQLRQLVEVPGLATTMRVNAPQRTI